MREKELRERCVCNICKRKIGQTGLPLFWALTIERHGLDAKAIQRKQGLELMLDPFLAYHMGPDEEMTVRLLGPLKLTICERCAVDNPIVHAALELEEEEAAKADEVKQ